MKGYFLEPKNSKQLSSEYQVYLDGSEWWSERFFLSLNESLKVVLKRVLSSGDTAIDIGANRGYFLKLMTELVGSEGTALGIEPNRKLALILESRNLDVLDIAISPVDSSEKVTFKVPKHGQGSDEIGSIAENYLEDYFGYSFDGYESYSVDTLTLDQILEPFANINFLKIDAEGLDSKILHSSTQIHKKVKAIVWEHNPKIDEDIAVPLQQKLESFGFKIFDCFMNELSLSTCLDPWVSPINRYAFQMNTIAEHKIQKLTNEVESFWKRYSQINKDSEDGSYE